MRRRINARLVDQPGKPRRPSFELAATIASGDSGAPVVDADGEIVGVVYARSTRRGGTAYAMRVPSRRGDARGAVGECREPNRPRRTNRPARDRVRERLPRTDDAEGTRPQADVGSGSSTDQSPCAASRTRGRTQARGRSRARSVRSSRGGATCGAWRASARGRRSCVRRAPVRAGGRRAAVRPAMRSRSSSKASRPISTRGWSTVVRDMWCRAARNVLSKPTIEMSSGTRRPSSSTRSSAPAATRSLAAKIAVGQRSRTPASARRRRCPRPR